MSEFKTGDKVRVIGAPTDTRWVGRTVTITYETKNFFGKRLWMTEEVANFGFVDEDLEKVEL